MRVDDGKTAMRVHKTPDANLVDQMNNLKDDKAIDDG
jgi:hypothetical protein